MGDAPTMGVVFLVSPLESKQRWGKWFCVACVLYVPNVHYTASVVFSPSPIPCPVHSLPSSFALCRYSPAYDELSWAYEKPVSFTNGEKYRKFACVYRVMCTSLSTLEHFTFLWGNVTSDEDECFFRRCEYIYSLLNLFQIPLADSTCLVFVVLRLSHGEEKEKKERAALNLNCVLRDDNQDFWKAGTLASGQMHECDMRHTARH